jgi:hypothetical protein
MCVMNDLDLRRYFNNLVNTQRRHFNCQSRNGDEILDLMFAHSQVELFNTIGRIFK